MKLTHVMLIETIKAEKEHNVSHTLPLLKNVVEEKVQGTLIYIQFKDKGEGLNIYKYLD